VRVFIREEAAAAGLSTTHAIYCYVYHYVHLQSSALGTSKVRICNIEKDTFFPLHVTACFKIENEHMLLTSVVFTFLRCFSLY
jgi:hypothetical protein